MQGQGHKLGQGHLMVKVIPRSNCKCLTFYQQAGGGPSTERHSCWVNLSDTNVQRIFYNIIIFVKNLTN